MMHEIEKSWERMHQRVRLGRSNVCEDWEDFACFYEWAKSRWFPGSQLDKDILGKGLRLYSPDTSAYITAGLNKWYWDGKWLNNKFVIPVRVGGYRRYKASFKCKKLGKVVDLGTYLSEKAAWQVSMKHLQEVMAEFALGEPDPRIRAELTQHKFNFWTGKVAGLAASNIPSAG